MTVLLFLAPAVSNLQERRSNLHLTETTMKKLLLAVTLSSAAACGLDPTTESFKDGFPRAETVALHVPTAAAAGQPLTAEGVRRDGLEGDPSFFYGVTRAVTLVVNGAVVVELSLLERITDLPPTTLSATSAVWGPYTDALSPNTWRFTVTRRAAGDYAYALEGKGKTEADTAYRTVLEGTHLSAGRAFGHGSFTVHWSTAATLPEHDGNVGTGTFTYARPSATDPLTVDADFNQVQDGSQLVDLKYRFRQVPGQGGTFEFQIHKDLVIGAALELLTVRSRWLETGAGRADARLAGGDLATTATANECWDSTFLSRYFAASFAPAAQWGTTAACSFATAEYAAP